MEKRTLILLITILILGFIISCDGVFLPRNDVQPFEYVYDFNDSLDDYLKDLNNNCNYSVMPRITRNFLEIYVFAEECLLNAAIFL